MFYVLVLLYWAEWLFRSPKATSEYDWFHSYPFCNYNLAMVKTSIGVLLTFQFFMNLLYESV